MPGWIRQYQADWLRPDLIAGLTLAAYLLPAAIGDASLANLPPEAGLYACLFSGLLFGFVCSSRHTVVTVTSALSLLIGASVGAMSAGDPARHAALAAGVALMVAAIAFVAWAMRAGSAVAFFSETVLVGFKGGLALYLASTQLPKLFGFKGTQGDFWTRGFYFARHLGETHPASLVIGAAALAMLIAGKLWFKRIPVGFLVVIGAIAAARVLGLGERGVALLGPVPQGLPAPGLPAITRTDLNELLPIAMACFVIAAVESAAIGRMFAQRHGHRLDANQELLAIAVANAAAGLGRSFPVSGGMSQSLVNESAGARTPLSGIIAAGCTLLIALFASGLLRNLPQPVLAAIVLAAVVSLFDVVALRHIWHYSRAEFAIAATALLGVLGSGPENGVLIGAAISIILLLRQTASPRVTELGRIPGTTRYGDVQRHPENERTPGVLVARCESSLLYFNVEHVRDRFTALIEERKAPIQLVVFFLGTVPRIDLAGAELIAEMYTTLRARGIELRLAESNGFVRDALRRTGFERIYGPLTDESVDGIISRYGPGHALTA
jgi:high affinity sulfate transporter 1